MITVRTVDAQGRFQDSEVPLTPADPKAAQLRLRRTPGASSILIAVCEDGEERLRFIVEAESDEVVPIWLRRSADGHLVAEAGNRILRFLAGTPRYPPNVLPLPDTPHIDVALLVDATMRRGTAQTAAGEVFLLASDEWRALVDRLVELCNQLTRNHRRKMRTAVLAFGDHPIPGHKTDGFVVYPELTERRLAPYDGASLANRLNSIRPVDGGDCIDALADGLAACRDLNWRDDARKLVLLIGDSPGYSVLDRGRSVPELADLHVRRLDVFEQARELHRSGVTLATLLYAASVKVIEERTLEGAMLASYVQDQYRELASVPHWHNTIHQWDPATFAASWLSEPGPLGRGPCPGIPADRD